MQLQADKFSAATNKNIIASNVIKIAFFIKPVLPKIVDENASPRNQWKNIPNSDAPNRAKVSLKLFRKNFNEFWQVKYVGNVRKNPFIPEIFAGTSDRF